MARSLAQLLAFNRGEVSKAALARVDVQKLQLAAQVQLNWWPTVTGAMSLRPGLEMIGETLGDAVCKQVPFVFSKLDTAHFELTANALRIRIADVLITRAAVSTVVSDPNFAGGGTWTTADTTAGCSVTIGGGTAILVASARGGLARMKQTLSVALGDRGVEHALRVVVTSGPAVLRLGSADGLQDLIAQASLEVGTHSLAFTPAGANVYLQIDTTLQRNIVLTSVSIEGAGVLSLPTPWASGDLVNVRPEQSGDVVYVDCAGKAPYRIARRSARGYGVEKYRPENGPFQDFASVDMTLTPSVYEGNGTLAASRSYFQAGHVGALFRLFSPGQANQATLGGANAYTDPIRVSGLGNDRIFGWNVAGSWVGTLTLQRSVTGPDSGFADVNATATNGLFPNDDTAQFDNVVCWYRLGFKAGDYTSGSALVFFGQTVSSGGATVGPTDISSANNFTTALHIPNTRVAPNRQFTISISNSYVGKVSLQKSSASGVAGFATVATYSVTGSGEISDTLTDADDATDRWYRLGFETGNFTSGTATLELQLPALSATGGSFTNGAGALAGGRYGICRVTGYNSPTSVNIEVLQPFSALTPTGDWVEGSWSDVAGWPGACAIHEGRLWHVGGQGWWGSQTNAFASFGAFDKWGTSYGDAAVVSGKFGSGPLDVTNWIVSTLRLLMGREQAIESGRSSSFDEPITPTAFGIKVCATDGADRLPAIRVDQRVLYVQQSHRRVFELAFNAQAMDYVPRDLTRLNLDVGKQGFVALAGQRQPDPIAHFVRAGGQSAALLYQPAEEVEGWVRAQTLGVIEDVCVLPSDTLEDRVYFVVRRTVNGSSKRFIERMALREECLGGQQSCLLDSFVRYSGAPATSITLAHLPSTTVAVWADGAYIGTGTTNNSGVLSPLPGGVAHSNIVAGLTGQVVQATANSLTGSLTVPTAYNGYPAEIFADVGGTGRPVHLGSVAVSGGAVTLPDGKTALTIIACLGYVAPFVSAKFGSGVPLGTRRRVDHLGLVLYDTHAQGIQFGQRFDALEPLPAVEDAQSVAANLVWPEYAEQAIEVNGEWDADARLVLLGQAPLPVTVGAAIVSMNG